MSISDDAMLAYYDVLADDTEPWTRLADERRRLGSGDGDPLAFKKALAWALVERFHGDEAADAGAAHFASVIGRKEVPDDVPETRVSVGESGDIGLLDLLRQLGLTKSNGEGRRLVEQGAVRSDGEPVSDASARLQPGNPLIKGGKRRFHRAIID